MIKRPHKIFYYLGAFALGGAFVFMTLGYKPQAITNTVLGIVAILIGILFQKKLK